MMHTSTQKKIQVPTSMILLGATGDLAQHKLLPALMDLYVYGSLPEQFHLVAFSRDTKTDDEYRDFARTHILAKGKKYNTHDIDAFLSCISYVQGVFEDKQAFIRIKEALDTYDAHIGMCSSKLFYLAVPPIFYETIFDQIAHVNLEQECIIGDGWTRILVEKPFGNDLASSQHLEKKLCELFDDKQIYRIDHYLAKDALQNIIAFRFSNVLFEERWCKDYVEGVYIQVSEKKDVGTRGAFFDGVGALRDVGQNHILQMLALIAMDRPAELTVDALRDARASLFQSLHVFEQDEYDNSIVKGQYNGYRDVSNVAPESYTETYFALKAFIDSPKWSGVPFYFEHGKALAQNAVKIIVRFRSSNNCVCGNVETHNHPNFVTFEVSPEQKITLRFWVRKPGLGYTLEEQSLVYERKHTEGITTDSFDAYEEVLFNALSGNQTLFVSNKEQEASWKYITKILKNWSDVEPLPYEMGSDGPDSNIKEEIKTLFT